MDNHYTGVSSVCTSTDPKIMSMNESGRGSGDTAQTKAESDSNQQLDVSVSCQGTGISTESAPELLLACKNGRLIDVRELVAGKKVQLNNCVANNPHGDTPLHVAAYFGHKDIVQYLVEKEGCEVDSRNRYQKTPLHRAARQGELEVVKYLIEEKGSDPKLTCHWKRTPLHSACIHGQLAVVKYLMSISTVDSSVKDILFEQTPLQLAAEWGTVGVVEYMMEHERQTNGLYRTRPNKTIRARTIQFTSLCSLWWEIRDS